MDMFLVSRGSGQGLGPNAARGTVDFLFRHRAWTEVTADPLMDNARAIRAWVRAGFLPDQEGRYEDTGKPCLIMVIRPLTG